MASKIAGQNVKANIKTTQRKRIVFCVVSLFWLALDVLTKLFANMHDIGDVFAGPFFGVIEFKLVHNTGGAWGIFGDMTFVLGVFSLLVCIGVVVFAMIYAKRLNMVSMISLALVFAGGLGNALDRFMNGYVIDLINTVFIDFPTFNIADIGITCGIIAFYISFVFGKKPVSEVDINDHSNTIEGR